MIRASLWLLAGAIAPQHSSFAKIYDPIFPLIVALGGALALPCLRRQDLLLFAAGFLLFWLSAGHIAAERLDPRFEGDSMLTDIHVAEFPRRDPSSSSFLAVPVNDSRIPARTMLRWHEPPVDVQVGDIWRVEVRLRRPRSTSNPGSMDYEAWLFRERIGATGYVVNGSRNVLLDSATSRGIQRLRERYVRHATRVLGADQALPVVIAVAIGARHLVDQEAWDRYARTGTSHLMAISGLHIGLAAMAGYLVAVVAFAFMGRGNAHFAALLAGLLVAFGYAALSGFAVPARRALLMLVCVVVIALWRREASPLRVLAVTMVLVIASDPVSTLSPGFRLSFAAVAALLWFGQRTRAYDGRIWQRAPRAVGNLATMQCVLLFGLMGLTVGLFGRVSLAAPLINLLAVPVFSVVTVPAVLVSIVSPEIWPLPFAASLHVAAASIGWIEWLIAMTAAQPSAFVDVADLGLAGGLLLLLPLLWVILPPGWPGRHTAWLAAIAVLTWQPGRVPPGCADIRVLDVGQGLAIVVETPEHVLVYDAGPSWRGGANAGERIVAPYLRSRGIARIDQLLISHGDLDHSGGAAFLLESMAVTELSVGEALPGSDNSSSLCAAGTTWEWDGIRFAILHPRRPAQHGGNDASCVLLVEAGNTRALLTGDIEVESEAALVRERVLPDVNLVSVPHHGSRTSSSSPFTRTLQPQVAIVSAGYGNRWGFPKADIVARWRASGAEVLNTAESGSISVRLCAHSGLSRPDEWRNQKRRIWQETDS